MIKEWLRANVPDFYTLAEAEKKAIADFSLLWPLFEGRILGTGAGVKGICKAVDRWERAGTLDAHDYSNELAYFHQRYFADGAPAERFGQLHFGRLDREDLVSAVLSEPESASPADQVKACLIVVYRYRNTLFHGPAWRDELRNQLENFNAANSILMKTLALHGRLADE